MGESSNDNAFWRPLRGITDLSLKFEETIFDLTLSSILIALSPVIIFHYLRQPVRIRRSVLLWTKIAAAAALVGVEISSLVSRAVLRNGLTDTTLAAASVNLAAALIVGVIIYIEHRHAIQASAFLGLYLFIGMIFDAFKCYSFFNRSGLEQVGALAAASCGLRLLLLTLQEMSKRELLIDAELRESLGAEATTGYWRRLFFTYLNPMFIAGFCRVLTLDDLGNIGPEFSSQFLYSRLHHNLQRMQRIPRNTLIRVCFETWVWFFLMVMIPRLLLTGFSFSQPFILHRVIESLDDPQTSTAERGFLLLSTFISFCGATLAKMATVHLSSRLVTRLRGALVTQLFDKNAKIPQSEARRAAALTLMSTDVDGVADGLPELFELFMTPVEVGLGTYFLSRFVGKSSFVVLVPLVISTVATYFLGKWIGSAYQAWNASIEFRVSKTSRILGQLKAIKIFGLGSVIGDYLQNLRQQEINTSKKFRTLEAAATLPVVCAELVTPVVVIAAALFWNTFKGRMTASTIFPSLSIIVLIKSPLSILLNGYPTITSMFGCFKRIQEFLEQPEREDPRTMRDSPEIAPFDETADPGNPATWPLVEFVRATLAPSGTRTPILRNATFTLYPGTITLVNGPNGAGKSLLLQSILGETSLLNGFIYITTRLIAFCGQLVWLQNISIRDNIIGSLPYNETLFRKVIRCCLLDADIQALPDGENYIVGTGGMKLSGGQRQRVALARALFAQMSIVVLDDVFSSLDRKTATAILANLCGQNGLLREINTAAILSSYLPECIDVVDQRLLLDGNGNVTVDHTFRGGKSRNVATATQDTNQLVNSSLAEETVQQNTHLQSPRNSQAAAIEEERETLARQKGDPRLYWLFIDPIGRSKLAFWCVAMFISAAGEIFPDIYMRLWIERHPEDNSYFAGYALIAVLTCFMFSLTCTILFAKLIPLTAMGLHKLMVETLFQANLEYLSRTDHGIIINRFSQDMSLIARKLPVAFMRTCYVFSTAILQSGVIVSGAKYMAFILPFIFLAVYLIQWFYLHTSRQMRALDLEAKSPLYTYIEETTEGLLHIRASGRQREALEHSFSLLDDSQKATYYMYCIQQWLGLVLGLLVAAVATVLMAFALFLSGSTSETAVGLAFLNLIIFGETLEQLIISWTSLETSVAALTRLREFMDTTPKERDQGRVQVPENWPSLGSIELQNVFAQYSAEMNRPPALQNLTLSIGAGQRVGVFGRTGSGKSSLFLTLLGFLESTGVMTIDGIDITSIPLNTLRSRIITISQDQIKLDASIRTNLLPFSINLRREDMNEKEKEEAARKDIALENLLTQMGIWSHLTDRQGLDTQLDDAGYSHGEMQLLCLARGILRYQDTGSKVVLIDEATSSVEPERERIAQRLMKQYFSDCTMLVIGHRKQSLEGVDFTVELSQGKVVHIDPSVPSSAAGWGRRHSEESF